MLRVLYEVERYQIPSGQRFRQWMCVCDCGQQKAIMHHHLKGGRSKSCGCKVGGWKHGMTGTLTHNIWQGMLRRCYDPNAISFKYYGARGIIVCERWRESFSNFIMDMDKAKPGMSIERINNDGNYEPSNCKWIPKHKQACNKRTSVKLEVLGVSGCVSELSRYFGIKRGVVEARLKKGWAPDMAFTVPARKRAVC